MQNKHLHIENKTSYIYFTPVGTPDVPDLFSNQEEADTRTLPHINQKNDEPNSARKFIIHTPYTDMLLLCLVHLHKIDGDIYIKKGVKHRSQIIRLKKMKKKILNLRCMN